jgi:hypothetical protein
VRHLRSHVVVQASGGVEEGTNRGSFPRYTIAQPVTPAWAGIVAPIGVAEVTRDASGDAPAWTALRASNKTQSMNW